jgi:hypothetical protein
MSTGRGMAQKSLDLIEHSRRILAAVHPTTVRGVAYQLFTQELMNEAGRREEGDREAALAGRKA